MKKLLLLFVIGACVGVIGTVVYQFSAVSGEGSYLTNRPEDAVCLKMIRVMNLVTQPSKRTEREPVMQLCDKPSNLQIAPKLLHVMGDTYDVMCTTPGYVASNKPQTVFFWDRGASYGEQISIRSRRGSEAIRRVSQCDRYGITPLLEN